LDVFSIIVCMWFDHLQSALKVIPKWRKLSLFYDIVSGQSPDYLQDLLPIAVGQTNNYNLRNSKNFTIPPGRLSLYQSSFFLKRNGPQTRCNFHNHNYKRQSNYI
jgi:hypothetical protein